LEQQTEEVEIRTPWTFRNPGMSSGFLIVLGIIALWILSNLRSPTSFNDIFTFLVVIPILILLPGVSLAASFLCVSLFKLSLLKPLKRLVIVTSTVAIALHALVIIYFIKTVPIFF